MKQPNETSKEWIQLDTPVARFDKQKECWVCVTEIRRMTWNLKECSLSDLTLITERIRPEDLNGDMRILLRDVKSEARPADYVATRFRYPWHQPTQSLLRRKLGRGTLQLPSGVKVQL